MDDFTLVRRAYTRTVPKELRPVHLLVASMDDVHKRWTVAMDEADSNVLSELVNASSSEETLPIVSTTLALSHQLASQVKAIKQELLVHLNALLHTATAEHDAEVPRDAEQFCRLGCSLKRGTPFCLSSDYITAFLLARKVWLWSICFSLLLADMDLLTGSLAFATGLFFHSTDSRDGVLISVAEDEINMYNGYGILTEELLRQNPAYSNCTQCEVFFCTKAAVTDTSSSGGDHAFVHGCAMLYSAMVQDLATSEKGLRQWAENSPSEFHGQATKENREHGPTTDMRRRLESAVPAMVHYLSTEDSVGLQHFMQKSASGMFIRNRYPGVVMLLRLLQECVQRRRWIGAGMANSFRPVIDVERKGINDGSMLCRATVLEIEQCVHSKYCTPAYAFLTCLHLYCLRDVSGPWPLPAALASKCLVLV